MKMASIAKCRKFAGTLSATVLLYAFQLLHQKMEFQKDGVLWWTTTRQDMMDMTGLTRHEYDGALARLRALGLVEVTHGPHSTKNVLRATWVRMTDWCLFYLGYAEQGAPLKDGSVLTEEQIQQIYLQIKDAQASSSAHP